MNRLALPAAALAAASLVAAALAHPGHGHGPTTAPAAVVLVGELIDTACFVASDGEAKGQDHAECAAKCLGSGVPAGILPEGATGAAGLRFLLTNPTVLAPHAGRTVRVEGTEHAALHAFDVKRLYVKEGPEWKEVRLHDEHHQMGGGGGAPAKSEAHPKHSH